MTPLAVDPFAGPWFDARTAAAYVRCRSVRAWYQWRTRHGIVAGRRGLVAKADVDRALKARRRKSPMTLASLANLELSPRRRGRA